MYFFELYEKGHISKLVGVKNWKVKNTIKEDDYYQELI